MEQPMSSLFKGSISEAIVEAKQQKKLFVVYVSGDSEAPNLLEESTSLDLNVADSISKYSIFLHLVQGSTDASHFSAIYLGKELSELGLFNRQALVVVPHRPASGLHKGGSSSRNHTSSDNDTNSISSDGYFGRVKRILYYVNPFSYISNNVSESRSEQGSNDGLWQYGPNPNLRNQVSRTERTNTATSENASNKNKKSTTSGFGSNIRTLRHYEDDGPSGDRNTFWNGNFTEFGGNNDGK